MPSIALTYVVSQDKAALAAKTAEYLTAGAAAAVAARGVARIAISGGNTPRPTFSLLADRSQQYFARMPWDRLDLFWVDERCVPPDNPDSNYGVAKQILLDHVPLKPEQIHRMEGELDPEEAASRYEATLRNAFRLEGAQTPIFDVILLGMGDDGHTASLFPHTEALHELSRLTVANHVPQQTRSWRITLTSPVINQAREVAFQIEGAAKAQLIHDVFLGPSQPEVYPSQLIRPASGALTLLLDAASAAQLPAAGADGAGILKLA